MAKCGAINSAVLTSLCAALAAPVQAGEFTIQRFVFEGAQTLDPAQLQTLVLPYTGSQRQVEDVQRAAAAVKAAYVAAGYPILQVYAPEQTLEQGVVVLRISEGVLDKVDVIGAQAYSAQNIRASLPPLREGQAPNTAALVAAVLLANDNPAKQVAVNFSAGSKPGLVDAQIAVEEDKISKFGVLLDNAGNAATGRERIGLSYQHANLFERDHVLSLQAMTSVQQPDKAASITGAYRVPFYASGLTLDLVSAYSDNKSDVASAAGPLFFSGKGLYLGMRLNQTLRSLGEYRHKLIYGLDYKDFKNSCSIAGTVLDNCGTITGRPLSISYLGQVARPAYQLGAGVSYFRNLPGGVHGQAERYGNHARNWQAVRASAFLNLPLADWQWRTTVNGQYSSSTLIPSEQFGAGGAASVRGYDERTAAGDRGLGVNLELMTPELLPSADGARRRHSLRTLLFYDAAWLRNSDNSPLAASHLASVGLGLRYSLDKAFSLRCDAGAAQVATPPGVSAPRRPNQGFVHASLQYSF
ncbi:ShlB/FhaC/HecB family hemolysin secretion/activation protein [Pseudoduganella danionis]|uniref:BamA/TamA family outer membrane protein n=1 Tax=Pseudoduganella danionis TaxID=1890295 RepID=A0ABW9SRQ5_9BURK|nr:ShlB/FhaC/HecB family hemolysin secretion/activation protein [Pseudoduganella danionis]MTW34848.1 BamA/TamA family outer membrane protein [Pseudoduganella danionis]